MRDLRALPLAVAAVLFAWRALDAFQAGVWWRVVVSGLGALGFLCLVIILLRSQKR